MLPSIALWSILETAIFLTGPALKAAQDRPASDNGFERVVLQGLRGHCERAVLNL